MFVRCRSSDKKDDEQAENLFAIGRFTGLALLADASVQHRSDSHE